MLVFPSTVCSATGVTKQLSVSAMLSHRRDEPAPRREKIHSQIGTLMNGSASYSRFLTEAQIGHLGCSCTSYPILRELLLPSPSPVSLMSARKQRPKAGMRLLHLPYQGPKD